MKNLNWMCYATFEGVYKVSGVDIGSAFKKEEGSSFIFKMGALAV